MAASNRRWWSVKLSDFGFEPYTQRSINVPECGINFVLYFIFRSFVFLYFISYMIYDLVTTINGFDGVRTFIFLTTWVYLLFNLYVMVSFINTLVDVYSFFKNRGESQGEATPTRLKFQWFMFNLVLNGSIVVSFTFWSLYYTLPDIKILFTNMMRNVNLHLLPAIFVLIDLLTTSVPVRFVHVIYPIFLGLTYVLFAVVYWKAGGTNPWGLDFIYPLLDFDDPRSAVVFVVEVIGASILCQAVVKGLYLLREWGTRKMNPSYTALDGTNTEHRSLTGSNFELPDR